jgi:hypothetical protein
VKLPAGWRAVHQLDTADLNNAIAVCVSETGGLGIYDDFSHPLNQSTMKASEIL